MKKLLTAVGAASVAATVSTGPAKAATELTLVYPFPDFLIYTKLCKQLAEKITKAGVKIKVLPFNSIGMFQQPTAVSKGRVDISCIPAAFYARRIPENEAISTSNTSAAKARANGGIKIIDDLHQKHFNLKYLGWTSNGGRFRIYMKNSPKFKDGMLDLSGVKMRGNPIYGAFLKALGANTHKLSSSQVYAALEKGVVNASAWATIGLISLKWDQFLRHGIEPEFYQTDIGWIMNLDRWKSLSAKEKKIIQDAVIEAEKSERAALVKMAKEERAKLVAGGMKFHPVPKGGAYVKIAVDSAYERMMGRLKQANRPTGHVSKLRTAFQE
jgi:TRAP-type C4-dicarboxylate transport system substrate-binding protein